MACPYFQPTQRFEDGAWLKPPRVPLGDPCRGVCRADGAYPFEPSLNELRDYCNVGYARMQCARFPLSAEADAVRFSISSDAGATIMLIYIVEKNYGPLRFGRLTYDVAAKHFAQPHEDAIILAQAERFLESYLNRRMRK